MNLQPLAVNLVAFCFAVIGCCSLPTLSALWLSKSRLHWLLQLLLIVVLAWPLTLVRAYDLLLIILVAGFSLLIGILVCSKTTAKKTEFRSLLVHCKHLARVGMMTLSKTVCLPATQKKSKNMKKRKRLD